MNVSMGILRSPCGGVCGLERGDEAFDAVVSGFERVLAQDRALRLVVQLEMDPVHREIAPALLRAPDELTAQPGPGRLRRHRLGLEDVHVGDRALDRAEKAMDADLAKYLPLWKLAVPAEFETYHKWDFSKFGRGERFVYKTIPHSEFDEVMDQVKRWKLDGFLKDKSYEGLAAR